MRFLPLVLMLFAFSAASTSAEPVPQTAADTRPAEIAEWTQRFQTAVSHCWNVDPNSEASKISVTVDFRLGTDGKIVNDVRLVTSSPGAFDAVQEAFQSARRAILRCEGTGYERFPTPDPDGQVFALTFDARLMQSR